MRVTSSHVSALTSYLIMICLLPACNKQTQRKKAAHKKAAFSFAPLATNIDIELQERTLYAHLDDVPTYVGSEVAFIDQAIEHGQHSFILSCPTTHETIKDFYTAEMDIAGWQKISLLEGADITMLFQKPRKLCLIILESQEKQVLVQIKIMERMDELR